MQVRFLPLLILFGCFAGGLLGSCANILPPSGGPKDTLAPRLLAVNPADSGKNVLPKKITLRFDEYVVVADASTQVQIAPLLPQNVSVEADLRTVTITLPDTLLRPNTTYRLRLGTAVRDLHENNPFPDYTYTFSTGNYFDSLTLAGRVLKAETGLPDTTVRVLLHEANAGDSAVFRQKPQYVVRVDISGNFRFTGLPDRPFRIYALGDKNDNLLFDKSDERIAFLDSTVRPAVQDSGRLLLRSFAEEDTTQPVSSAAAATSPKRPSEGRTGDGGYTVQVDTSNLKKRTVSLLKPVDVVFSGTTIESIAPNRIFLLRDSNGTAIESTVEPSIKPNDSSTLQLASAWQPNTVYTLRLLKGFVKDKNDREALPGKWIFRTKSEDDYARLTLNLPKAFEDSGHVLQVLFNDKDTVYQQRIEKLSVDLLRLEPGTYSVYVIEDKNRNGKWDPGNLIRREQAERVFSMDRKITLKAGWENVTDWKSAE